jgi:hypothetical protein
MADNGQAQSLADDIVSVLRNGVAGWRDVAGWDRADFLHEYGSIRSALVHSVLFAPNFVEIEGVVFLKELCAELPGGWERLAVNVREARERSSGDLHGLLATYNWLEVPYLFADRQGTEEELSVLVRAIADAWSVRLRGLYPMRNFEVRVIPPRETGSTIGVGFVERPA